jgi:hypothetical protein
LERDRGIRDTTEWAMTGQPAERAVTGDSFSQSFVQLEGDLSSGTNLELSAESLDVTRLNFIVIYCAQVYKIYLFISFLSFFAPILTV